ncbi:peptide deformylase [Patescibacteria group bacterium]|nr:MAG: peptide deformylase [Patescibacteria group bacterium]
MIEIVQKDDPVLRQKATEVAISEITSPRIRKILADMKEALASQEDGVALAAPQIGVPLRIFIVAGFALTEELQESKDRPDDLVFINPTITKLSKDKAELEEGCLSVRHFYGKTLRSKKATARAYNEKGEIFQRGGSGLLAQIFQHETDHLDGILFIDHAKEVQKVDIIK